MSAEVREELAEVRRGRGLDNLLEVVRREMEREFGRRQVADPGGVVRSEERFHRMWVRLQRERERRARLARVGRALTAIAMAVWNWKPLRLLLP